MNGISILKKEARESFLGPSACEDIARRMSVNQEAGSH